MVYGYLVEMEGKGNRTNRYISTAGVPGKHWDMNLTGMAMSQLQGRTLSVSPG